VGTIHTLARGGKRVGGKISWTEESKGTPLWMQGGVHRYNGRQVPMDIGEE